MINPGLMRDKIVVQRLISATDSRGNPTDAWEDYYSCNAYVNSLSGSEFYEAKKVNLENTVKFTVRYTRKLDGIDTESFRIIFRGRSYDITFVDNIRFENNTLKISAVCKDGNNNG